MRQPWKRKWNEYRTEIESLDGEQQSIYRELFRKKLTVELHSNLERTMFDVVDKLLSRAETVLNLNLYPECETFGQQLYWRWLIAFEFAKSRDLREYWQRHQATFTVELTSELVNAMKDAMEDDQEPNSINEQHRRFRIAQWRIFRKRVECTLKFRANGEHKEQAWDLVNTVNEFSVDFSDELLTIFRGIMRKDPAYVESSPR